MINNPDFIRSFKSNPTLVQKMSDFMNSKTRQTSDAAVNASRILKKTKTATLVVGGIGLFIIILLAFFFPFYIPFVLMLTISICITIYTLGKKKAINLFLKATLPYIVESTYGPNAYYEGTGGYTREYLERLELFPVRLLAQEDHIIGHYKNVPFQIADVRSYHHETSHSKNGSTTRTVIDFAGCVISVQMNKPCKEPMVITEGCSLFSGTSIDFESTEFNKKFNCYCNNREVAFYIVTPQLQLAILELEKAVPGGLKLLFRGNELVIAVSGLNTDFSKVKLDPKQLNENINSILDALATPGFIIETLNLDHKFFITEDDINKTAMDSNQQTQIDSNQLASEKNNEDNDLGILNEIINDKDENINDNN